MSTITVDGLTKRYGDTVALEDVSVEIPDGEFVVVLGVSGSGKSTLLRCLCGLTEPTEGTVSVDDTPVGGPREDVALIFQQHNIIEQLSAYGNALTGAVGRTGLFESLLRFHDRSEKELALEALDTVGLLEEARQPAHSMSGGQQQRVGIARALVQQPDVLLADEPVASLDPGSAQEVLRYLQTAADDRGLTTIVSLHQVNLARKFGHRFVGLRDGQKVFDGYREDLTVDAIDDIYGDIDTDGLIARVDSRSTSAEDPGTERVVAEATDGGTP